MNDNKPQTNTEEREFTTYFFSFKHTVGQYVDSKFSEEETLERMKKFAQSVTGDESVEIVEFRALTEEEVLALSEEFSGSPESEPTIN